MGSKAKESHMNFSYSPVGLAWLDRTGVELAPTRPVGVSAGRRGSRDTMNANETSLGVGEPLT